MKLKTLFLLTIVLIISCQKKIQTIEFEQLPDYELDVENNLYSVPDFVQYFKKDSLELLIYPSTKTNSLVIFDFKKKNPLKEIYFSLPLYAYFFINPDSIITYLYRPFNPDSTVLLINWNSEIKKVYSYEQLPIYEFEKDTENIHKTALIFPSKLHYENSEIIFILSKYSHNKLYDSLYKTNWIPFSFQLNVENNNIIVDSLFIYPDTDTNKQYDHSFTIFTYYLKNKNIFYSFYYTPKVIVYNTETKQHTTKEIKSYLVDSIPNNSNSINWIDKNHYFSVDYLNCFSLYFRFAGQGQKKTSIVMFDENYKVKGEAVLPISTYIYFTKNDTIYLFDKNKTFEKDNKIIFSVYKMKMSQTNLKDFVKQNKKEKKQENNFDYCKVVKLDSSNNIRNNTLFKLLSSRISEQNYKAIIIPFSTSCHTCVEDLMLFSSMNIKNFEENNTYLILVDENKKMVKEKLKEYSIKPNKYVIIDSAFEDYNNCFVTFGLEHLIVVRNGKIVFGQSYYANEIKQMQMDIFTK